MFDLQPSEFSGLENKDPDWDEIYSTPYESTSHKVCARPTPKDPIINVTINENSMASTCIELDLASEILEGPFPNCLQKDPHDPEKSLLKNGKQKRVYNVLRKFLDKEKRSRKKDCAPANAPRVEPKKEYVRIKLIRGHKRAIRFILKSDKYPIATIIKVDKKNLLQCEAWDQLASYIRSRKTHLEEIAKTHNGPLTDGESYHKRTEGKDFKKSSAKSKTFNNQFCNRYFSDEVVRFSFLIYIDVIFAGCDAEKLCSKFNFVCCKLAHTEECEVKWKELNQYLKTVLIGGFNEYDMEQNIDEDDFLEDY